LIKPLTKSNIVDLLTNVDEDIKAQLRKLGLQVTAQRLAVMRAITENPHATTDELTEHVRASIGSISRQAVYDTLDVFVAKSLIRRIQPSGSVARYEDRVGDNHHHLICRGCAMTFDIDCAVGTTPCLTAEDDHGFEIDEAEVVYWGRCPTCRVQDSKAHQPRLARGNNSHSRTKND
jgi:Fe2+ or Zn2+ uptake regulation protein